MNGTNYEVLFVEPSAFPNLIPHDPFLRDLFIFVNFLCHGHSK